MEQIDPALAGACGTWCGGCLAHRGELAEQAAGLQDLIKRQGFLGLARRLHPEEAERIDAFFEILDRVARTPACPGCGHGGGVVGCPVRACARQANLPTCAGCEKREACAQGQSQPGRPSPGARRQRAGLRASMADGFPFTASAFLERLTCKYAGWNLGNLNAIRELGLPVWLEAMAARPAFRTVQVKVDTDVFEDP